MKPLDFLADMAETANKLDLNSHMNLISKDVSVFGVPGFEVITYDDWYQQCEYEFTNKLLKQVSYQGLNVISLKVQLDYCQPETIGTDKG